MTDERLLDELAQSFLARYRQGERPTVTEYVQKHPELADRIRDLFPTLLVMEDVAPGPAEQTVPEPPRQLGEYRI
ncbi:MAG: hypothetical protein ACE10D_12465, partial [Planctomycetota bacterium]